MNYILDYLYSMRLYLENKRFDKFIINLFFLLIVLGDILPFWGGKFLKPETVSFLYTNSGLDILFTGPITILLLYTYTKLFNLSKFSFIYIMLYLFNCFFAMFMLIMDGADIVFYLLLAPLIVLPSLVGKLIYVDMNNFKNYEPSVKLDYKINRINVYMSIILPIIFINIIGRIYFHYVQ